MEKIDKILENLQSQEKTNTNTWKKSTKYKGICIICKKEFEFEAIPKSRIEAMRWEKGWDSPKKYFCSKKCNEIYNDREKLKEYKKWLEILPYKFRDIECDRKNLVQQGIGQSMFITGAIGVGKTVLMAGIAKKIIRNAFEIYYKQKVERNYTAFLNDIDCGVKWISYPGFIMELQSSFRKDDDEETPFDMAEEIASFPGTLAIDDIGAEKMTAFVQQITYYIINYREQEMLHTLITSNFSLQQIDEQIDTRVSSRIGGMCKIVKLTGKDRRLEKK